MADDNIIYRVDTTDAFPISNFQLDTAGVDQDINGCNPYMETKRQLLCCDLSETLCTFNCDPLLKKCSEIDTENVHYFLEPFARIQEIPNDYIDDFLNTLCYFYPDFIGDYFKRYISALQRQCAKYLKDKR